VLTKYSKIIFILMIALVLRLFQLGEAPRSLHADEASFLINSVAIIQTGHDEDNRFMPVWLNSIKDTKPALYSYFQIPFLAIFGVNTFASRVPSLLFGLGSILLIYILIRQTLDNEKLALITATVFAFSPWHIINSRSTQEVIVSFFFIVLSLIAGFALWQNLVKNKQPLNRKTITQTCLFFLANFLAMYFYHSAKIILPLFYGAVALMEWPKLRQNNLKKWSLLLLALVVLPLILTAASATKRFDAIGILNDTLPLAQISDFTANATKYTPAVLLRFFYNKPVFYSRLFLKNYFAHFTFDFYFLSGGATARHIIPAQGEFYLVESILMLCGLYYLLTQAKFRRIFPYWLIFLAVSPIAAAFTSEEIPSSTRSFPLILPLIFLIALGIYWLLSLKKSLLKYGFVSVLAFGYVFGFMYFCQQFFIQMPIWHSWSRSRDYAASAERIAQIGGQYQHVIVSNDLRELYIYLWLEKQISIPQIQAQPLARYQQVYTIGKFTFNRQVCSFDGYDKQTLMVGALSCDGRLPTDAQLLEHTFFDDHVPAFSLYTVINSPTSL